MNKIKNNGKLIKKFNETLQNMIDENNKLFADLDKNKKIIEKTNKEAWKQSDERVKNSIKKVEKDEVLIKTFINLSKM